MTTTTSTIWIETRTGQRMLLASCSCRTLALLVGEAVWTHLCQRRASALDARLLEVLAAASPGRPDALQTIARWSNDEREGLAAQTPPGSSEAVARKRSCQAAPVPEAWRAEEAELSVAPPASLAAFFPTADEWAAWAAGKGEQI